MGTLDIGWAIRTLKLGKKVRRRGWCDKNFVEWYKPPAKAQAERCKDPKLNKPAEDNGGAADGRGTLCHYSEAFGVPKFLPGWVPTLEDLLAEDWEEVEE